MVAEVTFIFHNKIPFRVNILLNTYKVNEDAHNWLYDLSFSRSVLEFKDIIAKKKVELSSNGKIYMPMLGTEKYDAFVKDYKRRYLIHDRCKTYNCKEFDEQPKTLFNLNTI